MLSIMMVAYWMAGNAFAISLPVTNASFEASGGWTTSGGVLIPFSGMPGGATDGSNVALFNNGASGTYTLAQTTANPIVAGQVYTLKADFNNGRVDLTPWTALFMHMYADDGAGTLTLLATKSIQYTDARWGGVRDTWILDESVSYVANGTYAGQSILIQIGVTGSAGWQPYVDNVRLDAEDAPPLPQSLPLNNAGFEAGDPSSWSTGNPSGWINAGGRNIICLNNDPATPEGSYFIYFDAATGTGQLNQYTSHTFTQGYVYDLAAAAKSLSNGTGAGVCVLGILAYDGSGTNQVAGFGFTSSSTPPYQVDDAWHDYSLEYTADASASGKNIAIYVAFQNGGSGTYGRLDNVRLEYTPVPVPATLGMLVFGGMAAVFRKKVLNLLQGKRD